MARRYSVVQTVWSHHRRIDPQEHCITYLAHKSSYRACPSRFVGWKSRLKVIHIIDSIGMHPVRLFDMCNLFR